MLNMFHALLECIQIFRIIIQLQQRVPRLNDTFRKKEPLKVKIYDLPHSHERPKTPILNDAI